MSLQEPVFERAANNEMVNRDTEKFRFGAAIDYFLQESCAADGGEPDRPG